MRLVKTITPGVPPLYRLDRQAAPPPTPPPLSRPPHVDLRNRIKIRVSLEAIEGPSGTNFCVSVCFFVPAHRP